jgi:hypothetical protein
MKGSEWQNGEKLGMTKADELGVTRADAGDGRGETPTT